MFHQEAWLKGIRDALPLPFILPFFSPGPFLPLWPPPVLSPGAPCPLLHNGRGFSVQLLCFFKQKLAHESHSSLSTGRALPPRNWASCQKAWRSLPALLTEPWHSHLQISASLFLSLHVSVGNTQFRAGRCSHNYHQGLSCVCSIVLGAGVWSLRLHRRQEWLGKGALFS